MKWSWSGAVALVLATCIGVGWAVAVILTIMNPEVLRGAGAALLYVTSGTLIGGVLTWLSSTRRREHDEEDRHK